MTEEEQEDERREREEKEWKKRRKQYYRTLNDTEYRWYVMQNANPKLVDFQLKRENALRQQAKGGKPLQLKYFIPFCFLPHTSEKENEKQVKAVEEANSLRDDLHDFVFIHATQRGIAKLLDREWNRSMRCRLYHYRDLQRKTVTISDEDMNKLISAFSERRIRFSIGIPVVNIGPDVEVQVIKDGKFKGQTARVIKVRPTTNGIFLLELGVKMFNGRKELKLHDMTTDDVQSKESAKELVGSRLVRETEASLLGIISRRVNHKETADSQKEDAVTLNHLFLYSYLTVGDFSLNARFLSLMLICATLRYDKDSTKVILQQVEGIMQEHKDLTPDILAYLNFSLYIATRDARYRTAGKQCVQQHPSECASESLHRLMALVGRMHSKRDRTKQS